MGAMPVPHLSLHITELRFQLFYASFRHIALAFRCCRYPLLSPTQHRLLPKG